MFFVFKLMELLDFSISDHKRYWISEYQNQKVLIPEIDEQRSISSTLQEAHDEINFLKQRLVKTKEIKAGMMQELLTGRMRLI